MKIKERKAVNEMLVCPNTSIRDYWSGEDGGDGGGDEYGMPKCSKKRRCP